MHRYSRHMIQLRATVSFYRIYSGYDRISYLVRVRDDILNVCFFNLSLVFRSPGMHVFIQYSTKTSGCIAWYMYHSVHPCTTVSLHVIRTNVGTVQVQCTNDFGEMVCVTDYYWCSYTFHRELKSLCRLLRFKVR